MKAQNTTQPARILKYKNPNIGQVHYLVERNDIDGEENWDSQYVIVSGFDRNTIISAIIRDKYTANEVEAILANAAKGEGIKEFMQFQNWRDLAKSVADGSYLKDDLQSILDRQIIQVEMPFASTLAGGDLESLSDYAVKAGIKSHIDVLNNKATVYLSFLLPDHQAALENHPSVTISYHKGI